MYNCNDVATGPTAAHGFGRLERIVGHALQGLSERPYVFTKCSLLDDGTGRVRHSLRRDSILREADASLKRLGVDDISGLDLSYTPPLGSPWDAVQVATMAWTSTRS